MNTVVLNRILSGSASLALLLLASGKPVCAAGSEGAPSLPEAREAGEAGWRYRVACHNGGKSLGPSIAAVASAPASADDYQRALRQFLHLQDHVDLSPVAVSALPSSPAQSDRPDRRLGMYAALSAKPEAAPSRSVTANTREVPSSSIHQTNPI